jgi:hypothetical protein
MEGAQATGRGDDGACAMGITKTGGHCPVL